MAEVQIRQKETVFLFRRVEKKYLLPPEQLRLFQERAEEHLVPDEYHKSLVRSVYYDTGSFALIRHSLDRPVYKEKLRVRSYGVQRENGTAFVELKKKYEGVVYKRRVQTTPLRAEQWLSGKSPAPEDSQTAREIDWFLKRNDVAPKVLISCDRISWKDREDPELRFTFDCGIRHREEDLHLYSPESGTDLLEPGWALMEIKIPGAAPLWLARLLSDGRIFPTTFSKYGRTYLKEWNGFAENKSME